MIKDRGIKPSRSTLGITTTRTKIIGDDKDRILKMCGEQQLPTSESHSLHCWSETYHIDGVQYEVMGEFSDDSHVYLFRIDPIR